MLLAAVLASTGIAIAQDINKNEMLTDLRTEMDPMLRNVIGYSEWNNF